MLCSLVKSDTFWRWNIIVCLFISVEARGFNRVQYDLKSKHAPIRCRGWPSTELGEFGTRQPGAVGEPGLNKIWRSRNDIHFEKIESISVFRGFNRVQYDLIKSKHVPIRCRGWPFTELGEFGKRKPGAIGEPGLNKIWRSRNDIHFEKIESISVFRGFNRVQYDLIKSKHVPIRCRGWPFTELGEFGKRKPGAIGEPGLNKMWRSRNDIHFENFVAIMTNTLFLIFFLYSYSVTCLEDFGLLSHLHFPHAEGCCL